MGVVYEAEARGRIVAIKVLHDDHATDLDAARRIRDEAVAARYISHPNVVSVLDYSKPNDSRPFVVMEHVRGRSLGAILRRVGALPLRRTAAIATQILAGLGAAHSAGVVHADIKSDNILVEQRRDGVDAVKIIDFGLASIYRTDHPLPKPEYDRRGRLLTSGTPEYMAPEVIRGEGAIPASDLYGVGVIIFEMITGKPPFVGGPAAEILERHLTENVVRPSLRRPDRFIPIAFERVVMRALEKEPTSRHASAGAFAAALAAATPATEVALEPVVAPSGAFSTEAPTHNFPEQGREQLAAGSGSRSNERLHQLHHELEVAVVRGAADDAVVASLEIARMLVEHHRLSTAVRELEQTVDAITKGSGVDALDAPPPLWRLLLTLAALYQFLGDSMRARRAACAAHRHATFHRSEVGRDRATSLLQRLA
jgi:serine/threonine protein kinase